MGEFIVHSAKGKTWKKHKYIKVVNGRYYYGKDAKKQKAKENSKFKPKRKLLDLPGLLTGHTQRKEYEESLKNAKREQGYYRKAEDDYRKKKDISTRIKGGTLAQHKMNQSLYRCKKKTLAQARTQTQANIAANEALTKYKKTPLYKIRKLMGKEK